MRRPPDASFHPGGWLAVASLCVHLFAGPGYGYFRDELYFIDCGLHPAWGYVDQPPLVPLIAAGIHLVWPGSLAMLRLLPALAHAATIMLTAETARILGGDRFTQALAALAVATGPVFLANGSILVTDVVQPLTWLFCAYALIRLIRGGAAGWWVAAALVAAVGLLSKYTLAFWLVGLILGLLATPQRRLLAGRWPWVSIAVTVLLVLPNVWWQAAHGFPFLELEHWASEHNNARMTAWAFMASEAHLLNLAAAPIWIAGLCGFAAWKRFADLRCIAIATVAVLVAMIVLHGRPYYPAGAYPVLFAGGAVLIAQWLPGRVPRGLLVTAVLAIGIIGLPLAVPILPVEMLVAYQAHLGLRPRSLDTRPVGQLPQMFADMFGWDALARTVADAYAALPKEDQARAVFLGENYGETAAIAVLGPPLGLPTAISGHNTYFLWGPGGHDGSVVLRIGGKRENLLRAYASVEPVGTLSSPWAMPTEDGKTLWLCRDRKKSFESDWASFRHYD